MQSAIPRSSSLLDQPFPQRAIAQDAEAGVGRPPAEHRRGLQEEIETLHRDHSPDRPDMEVLTSHPCHGRPPRESATVADDLDVILAKAVPAHQDPLHLLRHRHDRGELPPQDEIVEPPISSGCAGPARSPIVGDSGSPCIVVMS